MADNEVKQGFSLKYILLLVLAAVIGGYFQYAFPHWLDKKEQEISFSKRGGSNELNQGTIDKNIIAVKYSLKNDTSEVRGYYHKYFFVENTGNVGLENIDIQIASTDTNIVLSDNPKIEANEGDKSKVDYSVKKVNPYRHIIHLPVLNTDESIAFTYSAFSKKSIPKLDIAINIRKKDLTVHEIKDNVAEAGKSDKTGERDYGLTFALLFGLLVTTRFFKEMYNTITEFIIRKTKELLAKKE